MFANGFDFSGITPLAKDKYLKRPNSVFIGRERAICSPEKQRGAMIAGLALRSLRRDGAGTVDDVAARLNIGLKEAGAALSSLLGEYVRRVYRPYGFVYVARRPAEVPIRAEVAPDREADAAVDGHRLPATERFRSFAEDVLNSLREREGTTADLLVRYPASSVRDMRFAERLLESQGLARRERRGSATLWRATSRDGAPVFRDGMNKTAAFASHNARESVLSFLRSVERATVDDMKFALGKSASWCMRGARALCAAGLVGAVKENKRFVFYAR